MDALRLYDYLALARGRLFTLMRGLDDGQWRRGFPIGPGSLARTLTHVMIWEWYYIQRMQGAAVPPYEQWPIRDEEPPARPDVEAVWSRQEAQTRAALAGVRDWGAPVAYRVTGDAGGEVLVTTTPADLAAQLVLHEVHHRAQCMNMLRHLGIASGDLDFNALMFDRRDAGG